MEDKKLLDEALKAREFAYAKYSDFKVGAALLTKSKKVFHGCNVENISYGGTICAERVAVVKAISEGERNFLKIAIIADLDSPIRPCGICLQFLSQFCDDLIVIMGNLNNQIEKKTLKELLPFKFSFKDL
jgi:cytidine deaminase